MIAFLQGQLVDKQPTRILLDVGGVGYEVFIPLSSYDRLPPAGEAVRILTHEHIREDTHHLFGFMTDGERRMFEQLMDVSGVGPRIALSALSGMTVRELRASIVQSDVKRLSSISGIGKKLAERMVLELRDRIGEADALDAVAGARGLEPADVRLRDAVLALVALGYKQDAARKMVAEALRDVGGGELSVEDVVKRALASP